jgi:hypothetical protein
MHDACTHGTHPPAASKVCRVACCCREDIGWDGEEEHSVGSLPSLCLKLGQSGVERPEALWLVIGTLHGVGDERREGVRLGRKALLAGSQTKFAWAADQCACFSP